MFSKYSFVSQYFSFIEMAYVVLKESWDGRLHVVFTDTYTTLVIVKSVLQVIDLFKVTCGNEFTGRVYNLIYLVRFNQSIGLLDFTCTN